MNHKWIVGKNPKFILSVKSPKQQLVEICLTFINFIRFKSWLHTSNHNQSYFLLLCYYNIMYMITTWPHWFETILLSDYYYLYHEKFNLYFKCTCFFLLQVNTQYHTNRPNKVSKNFHLARISVSEPIFMSWKGNSQDFPMQEADSLVAPSTGCCCCYTIYYT